MLPAGVALSAVLALVWFNFVQIPKIGRYLNERNFRELRTIGAQIKSKVDNLDQAIDNAIDSFDDSNDKDLFPNYVRLFAPEIDVLQFLRNGDTAPQLDSFVESQVLKSVNDPPRIMIERDEGRNFLYLGYRRNGHKVLAKVDIEKVIADSFPAESDFDALLLVGPKGRVISKGPAPAIDLARIDRLQTWSLAPAPGTTNGPSDSKAEGLKPEDQFESLRTSSTVKGVTLGDTAYQMYMQPVQLSLPSATGNNKDAPVPEEWALCGLLRSDHLRAASS